LVGLDLKFFKVNDVYSAPAVNEGFREVMDSGSSLPVLFVLITALQTMVPFVGIRLWMADM